MNFLHGYRVLDLSRVLTGPYCSMILADLGADVIKVEIPGRGDDTREWGPPYINGESYYFLSVNRNKRSMTLNLKSAEGREIMNQLIRESDILLENFRPGTLAKLGFDYESVAEINPKMIYCSISGYGQDGPQSERPGYDFILQGEGGIMSLTGYEDGPPVRIGVPLVDLNAGMWAALGIISAMHKVRESGQGTRIDTSLLDASVASLSYVAGLYFATGESPPKSESGHLSLAPYDALPTASQEIIVCVGNQPMWQRFCEAIDLDIGDDPRFEDNTARVENREELLRILSDHLRKKPAEYWLGSLEAHGVPSGLIRNLQQVFEDDQVQHRGLEKEAHHPTAGLVKSLGFPVKFGGLGGEEEEITPPPMLGEHTDEILSTLGYSAQSIKEFRQDGVV